MYSFSSYYSLILSLLYLSLLSVLCTVSVLLLTDSLSSLSVSVICFMYSFSSYYSRILSLLYLSLLSVLGTVSVRITHGFSLLFICQFQFVLLTDSLSSLSVSVICFRYSFSSITHWYSLFFICLCYLFYVQFQFVLLTDSLSSLSVSVICFMYSFSSYYSRILSPLYLSLLSVLGTVSVLITHGFSLSLSVSVICFMYSFSSYYSLILSLLYLSLLSVLCTVSVRITSLSVSVYRITHGFSLFFICLCYLF